MAGEVQHVEGDLIFDVEAGDAGPFPEVSRRSQAAFQLGKAGDIVFRTGGVERARILDGGGMRGFGVTARKTTTKQAVGTASAVDLLNGEITIPAGAMGANGVLRLTAWGDARNNSGATQALPAFALQLGATTFLNTGLAAGAWTTSVNHLPWRCVCEIANLGASNSQWASMQLMILGGITSGIASGFATGEGIYSTYVDAATALGGNSGAVDTASANLLQLQASPPIASANVDVTLAAALVEVL